MLGDVSRAHLGAARKARIRDTRRASRVYVKTANKLIMGTGGTPDRAAADRARAPAASSRARAADQPGIGPGDGVMIAGDVRTLAREYCGRGVTVQYEQYDRSHTSKPRPVARDALPWLEPRFAGKPAPQDCSQIPAGNPLTPIE